jgi:sterol 3beta-glucosyltransferase
MNVVVLSLGSRGDLQPYLGLAVGLQRAGHRVTLAVPEWAMAWVQAYGVGTHRVRFDLQAFVRQPEIRAVLNGRDIFRQLQVMRGPLRAGMLQVLADFWEASQTADYIVASSFGYGGAEAASQRGVPLAYAFLAPFVPATRAFPTFLLPLRGSLGGAYNYLTYGLMLQAMWPTFAGPLNAWRTGAQNLPPWRSIDQMLSAQRNLGSAWLYGFSPSVLPKPADWPGQHHVTGYWYLDPPPRWQPTPALLRFLDAGAPPVYVGFGSLRPNEAGRLTQLVLRALALSGQRGVLLTGGLTPGPAAPDVFVVDDVPHSWLFPQTAAVVHHGGAGTTAAGLRAGIPSLITPFIGDQFAWSDLVAKLGVGPRLGGAKKLTPELLAQAIDTAINDRALCARAAALGEKIRAEDGVGAAVAIIEQHAAAFKARAAAVAV